MRSVFAITLVGFIVIPFICSAQFNGFPFGEVTYRELNIKTYEQDTSADAVVLKEFGEAYMEDHDDMNLIFRYHVKIKILKKAGLERANFEIPLRKQDERKEFVRNVQASTFNVENGSMREVKLTQKEQFLENYSKFYDIKKFALPNVRVGSVIDVSYEIASPFRFNFRSWEFQSDIPKIASEYWALIPANYKYNISLRGYLSLKSNDSEIKRDCFKPGGQSADCVLMKFTMVDIPAFKEEEYMTAKSNFLSVVNFELAEVHYFDGHKDKITREWKDIDDELRRENKFGIQVRRGEDIVDQHVNVVIAGETDELAKAQKIYDFIKAHYRWNDVYGIYSEFGIRKAFESKTGNVGDINLSLVAALKYAGLSADPLILSTRKNGLVNELYPVVTDFNYVVAKVNIKDKVYLLDATEDFASFGMLPERCLNGKGRVMAEKESYWYDLKPADKERTVTIVNLALANTGLAKGTINNTYFGYEAATQRALIASYGSEKEYVGKVTKNLNGITVTGYHFENVDDLKKPLIVKYDVEAEVYDASAHDNFLFNPFLMERTNNNPFKSPERLYPVDFGPPLEQTVVLVMDYPEELELSELPEKVGLALPAAGGRYMYNVQNVGHTVTVNSSFLINKTVYSPAEYHYLKELFDRVVAAQRTDLVFKKKS
ncbi:DUF3857 domain-containing protein [Chryseolinea lacunae]|uniref:DUF3857 domain-containing protein n=1 Tax=Chryseolinea lacunae TaxID=2801331 RepID=A0ABS1KP96_9BACT|nr:DUF3857 domain-containing protein [Chryseolinea lacunae]MBL0741251.1 DUF3857 domain-containing protein [Chryseolinea lacunae]